MQTTSIEWTDASWNPTRGCSRVSEGCRNCYAEAIAARFSTHSNQDGDEPGGVFAKFATMTDAGPRWTGKVELIESKLAEPLHWKKPRRVFVNSMSDLFHENLPDEAIDRVFAVMALCPQHTFQVLTKRPARMVSWFNRLQNIADDWAPKTVQKTFTAADVLNLHWLHWTNGRGPAFPYHPWPLPNVWLGVSIEDQATADERIPLLLQTPAAVRFVSYEPALGPVDFTRLKPDGCSGWIDALGRREHRGPSVFEADLDWVIAGGESGPHARPAHPQWFRDVRDACQAAGVPYFFKQWGEWCPVDHEQAMCYSRTMRWEADGWKRGEAQCADVNLAWIGKKAADRLLDGREWNEFPACP